MLNIDWNNPNAITAASSPDEVERAWSGLSPLRETPIATAATATYPANQHDRELDNALRSSAEAMRRYARFEDITAWVLAVAAVFGLAVLVKRFWK